MRTRSAVKLRIFYGLIISLLIILAALPSAQARSGPVSDDFHSTSLNTGLWSVVSLNDGSVSLNGTDTALRVPAGTSHDLWLSGNQALRVLQATTNTDFQVEVKFDSVPTLADQDQGIIVQTDANNYLRFDIFSDGSSHRFFQQPVPHYRQRRLRRRERFRRQLA